MKLTSHRLVVSLQIMALVGCIASCFALPQFAIANDRPNVLFVSIDDLRPELGCYGNDEIKTPHFDRFAKRATTFTRAYCQAAVCAPSFFLALGYYRPHLPFVAPTKYWELYDRETLSLASNPFLPKDAPVMAMNSAYELKGCYDLEHTKHPSVASLSEKEARLLKHGYYASVSFVDACLGKLLNGLTELGLDKNTIVVVWGDHGWKLGEHGSWCKQTNYEIDLRVPLLVHVPGQTTSGACSAIVELVDLYPTMCEAAGIAVPTNMEGTSFVPLLSDPNLEWKSAAFSQFHRNPRVTPDGGRYMGLSIVTSQYHYVQWRDWNHVTGVAGDVAAVELYDWQVDSEENTNIAGIEQFKPIVDRLSQQLQRGWRSAKPVSEQ